MKRPSHHHSSIEERITAFNYLIEGKTIKQTAELCGVGESTIKNWKRTYQLRGIDYLKPGIKEYRKYPFEVKCAAVREYLNGRDVTEIATRFDILSPVSITTWARDERFRGKIGLKEEKKPPKNYKQHKQIKPPEEMGPEEELEFLRMENAILKKVIALRTQKERQKKK